MKNTKFYDYACGLNAYELNRLSKYLRSPLYNEDERLAHFMDAVMPFIKAGTWDEINTDKIWRHVFGKTSFNQDKFTRLLSDTVKKLEHFLVIDRFRAQETLQRQYLLEIMNERKLNKHFSEAFSITTVKHQRHAYRDAGFYYLNFNLQQQRNLFLENQDQRSVEKNLQDVIEGLDTFYFIQKLKYCAALLHYKNFLSIEAEVALLPEILEHVKRKHYDIPAIQVYFYIINSFIEPENETHYQALKELLVKHHELFSVDELKTLFVFAMNYCINKINFGRPEYLVEILDLYKQALATDLLLEDGHLSQWDYKNIVTTALRVKEFKWVEKFIADYKKLLPPADRDNAYTFNQARYFFYTAKYDKVLTLLQDVKYNDIFYQLDSKTTLIKTYYELGEIMPLHSLKDSFRVMLHRKRLISPAQRDNYMNFLKLSFKLYKTDVRDKKAVISLYKEIQSTSNVADKTWLLEKVQELIG